ncbi:MAG: site-specific integrase [Candidatus Latescibacteria bacterium]|nr:site-specific integrase [Candidatus Latescibacterota bacterium]
MTKEPRYLTKEECRALLAQCPPHLYPIVLTALNTGMRKGELFNLMWEDVDFWKGIITVRNRKEFHTKNYENRTIPMNDLLWRTLRELPQNSTSLYVFENKSGRSYDDLKRSYHTAVKKAGLGHARFHDLRHTFASHLVMAGVDLRTVQALMGHKTVQMTMRYSHLAPEGCRGQIGFWNT